MREWQSSLTGTELPTVKQFFLFLTHQCQTLEATSKSNPLSAKITRSQSNAKQQTACVASVKAKCNYCQGDHSIYYCKEFLALPVLQRILEIRNRKICVNCLRSSSHASSKCTSGSCKVCQAKHNTLLHAASASSYHGADDGRKPRSTTLAVPVTSASGLMNGSHVMLSTAVVYTYDIRGSNKPCRVLLDCGSQANFISKQFLSRLGLKPQSLNISISGINETAATSTQMVRVRLQSQFSSYETTITCIIADRVTDKLPAFTMSQNSFKLPRKIKLADPKFYVSSDIDILIGAEVFWDLLCVGQIKASRDHPMLQKTRLGWILARSLGDSSRSSFKVHSFHASVSNTQLHDQLARLWQLDDNFDEANNYTLQEQLCEQHFLANVDRDPQGRYIVKLSIQEQVLNKLGDSRDIALRRLRCLEKRLARDSNLKQHYTHFIKEYQLLGHMRLVRSQDNEVSPSSYLPHHCVFKVTGQSSKLRVVFDASCKSSTGVSLNDALMVGPVVQQDLTSILIRFRTFGYVFAADIVKMYRQILVHPTQTRLQRILWRDNPEDNVDTYELLTVTYGTSSASYLATRCLVHLAEQCSNKYPVGAEHIKRGFYVDDILTGSDTLQGARVARDEVVELLRLGSFELSKWASNCPELLPATESRGDEPVLIKNESDSSVLRIRWNRSEDSFHFSYDVDAPRGGVTKRAVLSEVARLFDPLGLLGSDIVVAKLILQDLWQAGVQWDESVPQEIHTRWSSLKSQLTSLSLLRVPRCVKFRAGFHCVQLHGFCDASQRAYRACVYLRTELAPGRYRTELLCSRSRVAPLKAVSLPRLELSAAVLLARLVAKVVQSVGSAPAQVFLWSDSTITLNWVTSPSRKWSVFVANRVGEVQRLTKLESWHHVPSHDNPADILSRGLDPHELAATPV